MKKSIKKALTRLMALALSVVMLMSVLAVGVAADAESYENGELGEPVIAAYEPQPPTDSDIVYHSEPYTEPLCPNIEQYGNCEDYDCEYCDGNGELRIENGELDGNSKFGDNSTADLTGSNDPDGDNSQPSLDKEGGPAGPGDLMHCTCDHDDNYELCIMNYEFVITAFTPLAPEIANQTVPFGTELEQLNLPETLTAKIAAPHNDNDENTETNSPFSILNSQLGEAAVTWHSTPEYDGYAGEFIFTATLSEDYTLADGVAPPQITVTVEPLAALFISGNEINLAALTANVAGENWNFDISTNILTIEDNANLIITGTVTGGRRIEVEENATANITLNNVSITGLWVDQSPLLLNDNATLYLTIQGTNTLTAGGNSAGIQLAVGRTLTIDGTGSLTAQGGNNGAGIGSGSLTENGTVIINGGTVTAIGGGNPGAGIGGGFATNTTTATPSGGNITINGGTVTATGGQWASGIGGGDRGIGGIVTITGGTVIAQGGGSGIGGGSGVGGGVTNGTLNMNGGLVFTPSASDSRSLTGGILVIGNDTHWSGDDNFTLGLNTTVPSGRTLTIGNNRTFTIPDGVTLTNNGIINIEDDGTLTNDGVFVNNYTVNCSGTINGNGEFVFNADINCDCGEPGAILRTITNLPIVVTVPMEGEAPASIVGGGDANDSDQWTATVVWEHNGSSFNGGTFTSGEVYSAIITITPQTGWTLSGMANPGFTVHGAVSVTRSGNVVTAVFSPVPRQGEVCIARLINNDSGHGWSFANNILTINSGADVTITGTVSNGRRIEVATNATANITIRDLHVTNPGGNQSPFRINNNTNVTLTVSGTNTLTAQGSNAGIRLYNGNPIHLTIIGDGTLNATGGANYPGIGGHGGNRNITINLGAGGEINAQGGNNAAGIGGRHDQPGGNITITGGTITASGGGNGAGIGGGGNNQAGGNIVIYGENTHITATGGGDVIGRGGTGGVGNVFVALPVGNLQTSGGTNLGNIVTFTADPVSPNGTVTAVLPTPLNRTIDLFAGLEASKQMSVLTSLGANNIRFALDDVSDHVDVNRTGTALMQDGTSVGFFTIQESPGTVDIGAVAPHHRAPNGEWSFNDINSILTIHHGDVTVTGEATDGRRIEVSNGATASITLRDLSITTPTGHALLINNNTNVTLTVSGTNTLTGGSSGAGIQVTGGTNQTRLTINGNGTLNANGGGWSSGIGGGGDNRHISIELGVGGVINAQGADSSAGIIAASAASGSFTVRSGAVIAQGGSTGGAGISNSNGVFTIYGGTVIATGGNNAAGIGGNNNWAGGTTNIRGGTVIATGGNNGAGIGGGQNQQGGNINISGGAVTATGSGTGAGIGGAGTGAAGNIVISGTARVDPIVGGIGRGHTNTTDATPITFQGTPTIIGDTTLRNNATVAVGATLTINSGVMLTNSGTLTNNGIISNRGTISTDTAIIGNGTIDNNGYISIFNRTIIGATVPVAGETPATVVEIGGGGNQWTADITWQNAEGGAAGSTFTAGTAYTAIITITRQQGWTLDTVPNPGFTVPGATAVTRNVGEVTAVFPPALEPGVVDIGRINPGDSGPGWSFVNNILAINSGSVTVTGAVTSGRRIIVDGDATVTINNSSIATNANHQSPISVTNDATLTLNIEGTNTLSAAAARYAAGLNVSYGNTVIISGTGSLTATGGYNSAGIGGNHNQVAGNITIQGGNITARSTHIGAGIGGGRERAGGTTTITGGIVHAHADHNGAAIGGGHNGDGGNITIGGNATVVATNGRNNAGLGAAYGRTTGSVTIEGNALVFTPLYLGTLYHAGGMLVIGGDLQGWDTYNRFELGGDITIPQGQSITVPADHTLVIPSGHTLTNRGIIFNHGTINNDAGMLLNYGIIFNHGTITNTSTVEPNAPISIRDTISYLDEDGVAQARSIAEVTIHDISAGEVPNLYGGWHLIRGQRTNHRRITINSTEGVHIILEDGSHLSGGGITVQGDNRLTIYAQSTGDNMGRLTAAPWGSREAGIGGTDGSRAGTIIINGGIITATGTNYSAGIGGGSAMNAGGGGGTIIINGGTVSARGSGRGACIGGSGSLIVLGAGDGGSGGIIIISGNAQVGPIAPGTLIIGPGYGNSGRLGEAGNTRFGCGEANCDCNPTITGNTELRGNRATVRNGATLTVGDGATLNNRGELTNDGEIVNNGTWIGNNPAGGEFGPQFQLTVEGAGANSTQDGYQAQGSTVHLDAGTAPANQRFVGWTANPSVTFLNAASPTTSFTMPSSNVTVTANWVYIAHQLIVENMGVGGTTSGQRNQGATINLDAGTRNGYQFVNWTVSFGGATLTDPTSATGASFTMPSGLVVVVANWELKTWGIILSQTGTYTFDEAAFGYSTAPTLTVTVTNTGNQPTGELTVALGEEDAEAFTLAGGAGDTGQSRTISSIEKDGTQTFTVVPNTGLAVGTYSATVTVSGDDITAQSFNVSFEVTRATPIPPNAPTEDTAARAATSITLSTQTGVEFGISDSRNGTITWQEGNVFANLQPNSTHYFFVRLLETATHYVSEPSVHLQTTTNKAALDGTVTITGNAVYGQTLTANTTGLTTTPQGHEGTEFTYQWQRGTTDIPDATNNTYTLTQDDIGEVIRVVVTAAPASDATGSVTSDPTTAVAKASQTAPNAPTMASRTATSITLTAITGTEFRLGGTGIWRSSPEFTNLHPNSNHSFYARLAETDTHNASPASTGATFTTDKATLDGTVTIDGNAIYGQTLTANTTGLTSTPQGHEGTDFTYQWQRGTTDIPDATSNTYTLTQDDIGATIRVIVTAAPASDATGYVESNPTAQVAKASQTAPNAPTMASSTATSITLDDISEVQFRLGPTGQWRDSSEFTDLSPNRSHTFYARLAETDTHNASPASTGATFTTDKATLGGTVTIDGNAIYGQTLTANTTGLTTTPQGHEGTEFTYQWQRGTTDIPDATSNTYTLTQDDIGATIRVIVTAAPASDATGYVESNPTAQVAKAQGPTSPPNVQGSYTGDGTTFTFIITPIAGAEYRMGSDGNWQESRVFSGIDPSSTHTFYARIAETATHLAGAEGSYTVTFNRLNRDAPSQFTMHYKIGDIANQFTVEIPYVEGAEYSFDGTNFSSLRTTTAAPGETVTGHIRYSQTLTHNQSPATQSDLLLPSLVVAMIRQLPNPIEPGDVETVIEATRELNRLLDAGGQIDSNYQTILEVAQQQVGNLNHTYDHSYGRFTVEGANGFELPWFVRVNGYRIAEDASYFTNFDYVLDGYSLLALHRITLTNTLSEEQNAPFDLEGQTVSVEKSGVDFSGEQNIRIAHKDGDGILSKMDYIDRDENSIVFETPSFSLFGVIAPVTPATPTAPTAPTAPATVVAAATDIPRTGDGSNIGLWIALMLSSMAALGIMIFKWHRRRA